jgi:hypothetical protein
MNPSFFHVFTMQSMGPENERPEAEAAEAEAPSVCSLTFTVSNGYLCVIVNFNFKEEIGKSVTGSKHKSNL